MNGMPSTVPSGARVARISSRLRTSTRSPALNTFEVISFVDRAVWPRGFPSVVLYLASAAAPEKKYTRASLPKMRAAAHIDGLLALPRSSCREGLDALAQPGSQEFHGNPLRAGRRAHRAPQHQHECRIEHGTADAARHHAT